MDRLFYDLLNKVHQDHRDLCARGLALRRKLCAAAAGDQPGCHGPAHCVAGPGADLRVIGIGGQLRAGAHVIAAGLRITEENGRQLFARDGRVRREVVPAQALDDAIGTAGVPVFVPMFVLESFSMTSLRVCLQTEQV